MIYSLVYGCDKCAAEHASLMCVVFPCILRAWFYFGKGGARNNVEYTEWEYIGDSQCTPCSESSEHPSKGFFNPKKSSKRRPLELLELWRLSFAIPSRGPSHRARNRWETWGDLIYTDFISVSVLLTRTYQIPSVKDPVGTRPAPEAHSVCTLLKW